MGVDDMFSDATLVVKTERPEEPNAIWLSPITHNPAKWNSTNDKSKGAAPAEKEARLEAAKSVLSQLADLLDTDNASEDLAKSFRVAAERCKLYSGDKKKGKFANVDNALAALAMMFFNWNGRTAEPTTTTVNVWYSYLATPVADRSLDKERKWAPFFMKWEPTTSMQVWRFNDFFSYLQVPIGTNDFNSERLYALSADHAAFTSFVIRNGARLAPPLKNEAKAVAKGKVATVRQRRLDDPKLSVKEATEQFKKDLTAAESRELSHVWVTSTCLDLLNLYKHRNKRNKGHVSLYLYMLMHVRVGLLACVAKEHRSTVKGVLLALSEKEGTAWEDVSASATKVLDNHLGRAEVLLAPYDKAGLDFIARPIEPEGGRIAPLDNTKMLWNIYCASEGSDESMALFASFVLDYFLLDFPLP